MKSIYLATFKACILNRFNHNELTDLCQYEAKNSLSDPETTALYAHYSRDIWQILYERYEQLGFSSYYELIESFHGIVKATNNADQCKRLLVCYAIESIAFDITQGQYLDEDSKADERNGSNESFFTERSRILS